MIGIFDSGIGGLTVVKEILKELPGYPIVYFGDTARLPYGTKGADFVKKYSKKIIGWLLKKQSKIIIIACNTSSAWASNFLRNEFKNIPIFDMITSTSQEVFLESRIKKIGIIGTPGTIKSKAWDRALKKIDSSTKIYTQACPLFVPMVEMGFTSGLVTEKIAREYLKNIKANKVDVLVLACTHYPLLNEIIKKVVGPSVKIINPAKILAKKIKKYLQINFKKIDNKKKNLFFFSDNPYNFEKISYLCFNKKINPKIIDPF